MTPVDGSKNKNESKFHKLFYDKRNFNPPKYKIDDLIRIPDEKNMFSK